MQLSEKAITELKEILQEDIGDAVEELSPEDLQSFGSFVLSVTANSLKVRARRQKQE